MADFDGLYENFHVCEQVYVEWTINFSVFLLHTLIKKYLSKQDYYFFLLPIKNSSDI